MQDTLNSIDDDEIDLRELFMVLWAYKLLIASICIIGVVCGGYYALNTEKMFTSSATFKLDEEESNGIRIGGDLAAIASLTGISAGKHTSTSLSKIKGRIFIEKIDKNLNFQTDPYYNNYDPNALDPNWKSIIKRIIGWKNSSAIDVQEIIWQRIIKKYLQTINLEIVDENTFKVSVTHSNPVRASIIANAIMEEIISDTKDKNNSEQDEQLSYLSNTLAKALDDLEIAQSKLKVFALENSAMPIENFVAGSLQLDELREKLNRTTELHNAVAELSRMLKNNTTDHVNYVTLRQKFPIVDQVEFRRVMGQNEIISSWSWPEVSTVNTVFDTLSERKNRLQSQINASQIGANRSSRALATYGRLEREAKIAEATYTVLIEQVKAQSMVAGFRPSNSEVYEYASPPVSPSAPNRNIILILSAVLGLFFGSALSFVLASCRNVYYSNKSLITNTQSSLNASYKTLLPLRNKNLNMISTLISKKPQPVLRDFAVEINKSTSNQVLITSSRAKITANNAAQALALTMISEDTKIAVIDFSKKINGLNIETHQTSVGSFFIFESEGHVSILRPHGDLPSAEFISQKDFFKNIQLLNSSFNLVFLCADNDDAISLLRALEGQKMFHLSIARTKHSKRDTLQSMRSLIPIQGLLHD